MEDVENLSVLATGEDAVAAAFSYNTERNHNDRL